MHDNGKRPDKTPARRPNFYAQFLPPEQQEALDEAANADDLGLEIAYLRVKARALMEDPDADPRLLIRTLEVLARLIPIDARMRLARR